MHILLVATLLIAGCSETALRDNLTVGQGCYFRCDWCVGLQTRCAEELETKGHEDRRKIQQPLAKP